MLRSLPGRRTAAVFLLFWFAAAGSSVHGAAAAQEDLPCDAYAAAAVAHNQQNAMMKCGFTGNRWSNEFTEHAKWCEAVPPGQAKNEDYVRRFLLERCAAKPGEDQQACQSYAEKAVSQQQANVAQGCGLDGDSWSNDFAAHFNWCLAAAPEDRQGRLSRRDERLDVCLKHARAR